MMLSPRAAVGTWPGGLRRSGGYDHPSGCGSCGDRAGPSRYRADPRRLPVKGYCRNRAEDPRRGPQPDLREGEERPVPLRRNAGFQFLWTGQILSDTGSGAGQLAYPLLILALTHSPVLAGVVGTATSVAQLSLQLPAGALSDRLDRRLTMIICDTLRAVLLAVLGVLVVLHLAAWPTVLLVAVLDSAADVIFMPAATAALPQIVDAGQLEQAWAATEGRTYAAGLAGPALGGLLFGIGRALPFLGDAVSYLISAATVSRIRGRFRPEQAAERKGLWHEVLDGVRFVWRTPLLRAVVAQAPLVNFAFTGVLFTITVALRRHGTAPGIIGLVQAGIAAGGLAGAVIAPWLQRRLRLSRLVLLFTVACSPRPWPRPPS
jgi:MFS family permease